MEAEHSIKTKDQVLNKENDMIKVITIKNNENQKTIGMENRQKREFDPHDLIECKKIKKDLYAGKYTEFEFDELSKEEILEHHYLDSNRPVVLASPKLQEIFNKYAPNDVQFIPTTLKDKNGETVDGYAMINILTEVEGHDPENTEYKYIDYFDDGNLSINGINKIKYFDDAMGEHLIGRDKNVHSAILFSEKFYNILKEENIKLKDFKYYLAEEWYDDCPVPPSQTITPSKND
jgi:hypothetical protein